MQAPVTLGDGNTGKPALDQLPVDAPNVSAPKVHQAPPASSPVGGSSATIETASTPGEGASPQPAFDPRQTPDPELAETSAYYELTLRYCEAGVHLVGARRVELKRPTTLPRLMGRFAAELWIGRELLERDRFDFPLVAADELPAPDTKRREPPPLQLGPRADVVWKVKVAERVRATQAWIIDRATGERWLLDWPPTTSLPKPTADAPCPSFGGK